jgi:hypothetical protein
MKKNIPIALLFLGLAHAVVVLAAETKPPVKALAAAASFAGEFSGEWTGENGSSGALKLTFKPGKDAAWEMDATFTFEGSAIPTVTKSVVVDGSKLEAVFAWDVQGASASSKLTGELKDDRLEGTYDSTTTDGAAKGKWKVKRAPLAPKLSGLTQPLGAGAWSGCRTVLTGA